MRTLSDLLLTTFNLLPMMSLLISISAQAKLTIFACEPEWAALSRELAPEASVYSATTAQQDPHYIQARPGLISKMRGADLAVCAGAELEVGWLPVLQMKSANPAIQSNSRGMFFAADQVETIGKLDKVDPTMGDVHPDGNPHLHLDPYRLDTVAQALAIRMGELDSNSEETYRTNAETFSKTWQQQIIRWEKKAAPLKGKQVITYHGSFDYLFQWLGIKVVGDLEPKPGLPPTSQHLASLLKLSRTERIDAIIYASSQNSKGANWLSEKTGIPATKLPISVGGSEQSTNLVALFDSLIDTLLNATGES